jgi:tRNA pseudouridine55 synthase
MDIKKIKKNKTMKELLEFGIINIDKSSGPTSFNVSEFVKKKLKLKKTSHFGTLDPKVTGVLPVALSRGCKLTGFFLGEDKEYIGIMRIHEDLELEKIEAMIKKKFLGKILQTPPVKSRVKRQEREREIIAFDLLEKTGKDILFRAEVQGGTYIRKLLDDLGRELGIGAHMLELRRIRAGIFMEETIISLYDFEKAVDEYKEGNDKLLRAMIVPGEIVSEVYPAVEVKVGIKGRLFTGKPIFFDDVIGSYDFDEGQIISVFAGKRFVGMYEVTDKSHVFAKSLFVFQPVSG